MRGLIEELLLDNPVLAHASTRLSSSFRRQPRANNWIAGLLATCVYLVLVTSALQVVEQLDASVFLFISLLVSILATVTVLYGTIAGERERGSIELLLAAPVTGGQIVVAKLARAFWPCLAIVAGLNLPALVFGTVREFKGLPPIANGHNYVLAIIGSVLLSMVTAWFVAGLTLYLSACSRTTSSALVSGLGALFGLYVLSAFLAGSVGVINRTLSEVMMAPHPFSALSRIAYVQADFRGLDWQVVACFVAHAVGGAVLVYLATQRLESERKRGSKPNA